MASPTEYKKIPVRFNGRIYAGFMSDERVHASVNLKLGLLTRRLKIADEVKYRATFDEMARELESTGKLTALKPDPYLTEIDAAARREKWEAVRDHDTSAT